MSYHIAYNPELGKRYPSAIKKRNKLQLTVVLLMIVILASIPITKGGLLRCLIPGDPAVTSAAFSALVESVGAGEPVKEALFSFCEDIIGHSS